MTAQSPSLLPGLSEREAQKRLKEFGPNEIKAKPISALVVFLRQFKSSLIYLLFFAALLSFFLGEFIDGIIIIVILLANGFLGFLEEWRSEKALDKLKTYIVEKTHVLREGRIKYIDRRLVVPGDLCLLEPGDVVPADLKLTEVHNLEVNESILTGESVSVRKTTDEIIYQATNIIGGMGRGLVVSTGKNTKIGKIAELTVETKRKSGFEENVLSFSKFILKIVIVALVLLFIAHTLIKGLSVWQEFLLFVVALAVGVIPEALPLITTITLVKGALSLAHKRVVVKRLAALEDLGNIEILCTDKTGTITENKLILQKCIAEDQEKCFLFGLLGSSVLEERKKIPANSFDAAIFKAAPEESKKEEKKYKKIFELPFDPVRRRNALIIEKESKYYFIVRGAPEAILKIAKEKKYQKELEQANRKGLRTFAIAYKEIEKKEEYTINDENELEFIGFFSLSDPLKSTTRQTIAKAKDLGIEIKILTGDSASVAKMTAEEAGIITAEEKVFTGEELDKLSAEEFLEIIKKHHVFARLNPEQKFKIVQGLQRLKPVGFLGEGINDAPALKLANAAIVVESGADVSKEAGDIILLEKDLSVVVDGIAEGRKIFSNVIKYIKYTLTGNFGNFYAIAVISLFIDYLPMLPVQILLVNFLSDLSLVAVATDNVDAAELKRPKHYNIRELGSLALMLGLVSSFFDFIFFALFYKTGAVVLRTAWFMESVLSELVMFFSIRTRTFFLKALRPSKMMLITSLIAILLTVIIPFTDLGRIFHFINLTAYNLLLVALIVLGYLVFTEVVKLLYYKRYDRH